ncbi:MAG: ABC transporter ATP-binding protein [Lentisphaeria bacterium]|nr:ABC transporter ATP-binding protein [Lentisphaeria bacterium]
MERPIIEISHLTKQFKLSNRRYGLKGVLLHLVDYLHDMRHPRMFTALDDISLSVRRGERIGLTGQNGCGKTTLLSVIGGVYRSYRGRVDVRGRVSMMLALGAGMHPELSGRENIILNGVLQGKTRREMQALMDDIVDFADIGEFIDAPLYQYSSGMKARLGFGVITAIDPEILLVDEVLAVGDAEFKKKCVRRIGGLLERGCTLFLVSHNANDIRRNCDRVIRLDHGRVVADGPVAEVIPEAPVPAASTP